MPVNALRSLARFKLACAAMLAAGAVLAGQMSAEVGVRVRLVSSSGVCGAVANKPKVEVACEGARGPLLPEPGSVPYRRVGTIRVEGVVAEPLPVHTDGTKITSWRVVALDNARYVELTIAW